MYMLEEEAEMFCVLFVHSIIVFLEFCVQSNPRQKVH